MGSRIQKLFPLTTKYYANKRATISKYARTQANTRSFTTKYKKPVSLKSARNEEMAEENTANGALGVIFLIAIFLFLYLVIIPAEDRAEFIDVDTTSVGTAGSSGSGSSTSGFGTPINTFLYEEQIGRLQHLDNDRKVVSLTSSALFSRNDAGTIASTATVYTKKSALGAQQDELRFELDNPSATQSVLLTFQTMQANGRLIITLNGEEIYNNEITSQTIPPITLPKEHLHTSNVLIFEASSPGFTFWATNEYTLESVRVVADRTDTTGLQAATQFVLSSTERNNIERAQLRFRHECRPYEIDNINVRINDHTVISKAPLCGEFEFVEFVPEHLRSGENAIMFTSSDSGYIADQVQIILDFEEAGYPLYFFEITEEELDNIDKNTIGAYLDVRFADQDQKYLNAIVNGYSLSINTDDRDYSLDIESYLREGTNSLKLEPRRDNVDITSVRISSQREE